MSAPFDPYHKWLGIPLEEQPPNHYRLLGIKLFESDPDVISNAADQRMAHVRTLQMGPHVADSQRLLNEIANARVTLLNPGKKQVYDASLPAPSSGSVDSEGDSVPLPFRLDAAPSARPAMRRRKSNVPALVGLAVFACLAAVLLVAFVMSRGAAQKTQIEETPAERARGETGPAKKAGNAARTLPKPIAVQTKPLSVAKITRPPPQPKIVAEIQPVSPAVEPKPVEERKETPPPETETTEERTPLSWPALTAFLNDLSHWKVVQGNWRTADEQIVGSGASILAFKHPLPRNFAICLTMNVIDGMRPRVRFFPPLARDLGTGQGLFYFGNEGYEKSISLFAPGAKGSGFRYENKQTMKVRLVAADTSVRLYINNALVAQTEQRAKTDALTLSLSGGDYWSRGTTAFSDFSIGPVNVDGIPPSAPAPEQNVAKEKAKVEPEKTKEAEENREQRNAKKETAHLATLLRKKLHGRVFYDARRGEFTLVYNWASRAQLRDFDLSKATVAFVRGALRLRGGESVRHVVDFKEVAVAVPVLIPQMKGTLIETSGGVKAFVGGASPDTMYLNGGGEILSMIVPDNQRKGIQPVQLVVTPTRLGFSYGIGRPSSLGKAVTDVHAGQVELFGGDVGYQYGTLFLRGTIDERWLQSYVERR